MGKSAESLSCECGQVLFDVAGREPGETLTCPWCNKEYRYLGGKRVEPVAKGKSTRLKQAPEDEARVKGAKPKSVRKNEPETPKESAEKIKVTIEGEEEVFSFTSSDRETVKMKSPSLRKPAVREKADDDADPDAPPKKKGPGFGDAPGGVFPMLGFMAGFSVLAFVILGTLFPEDRFHKRQTPWGDPLSLRSPWPELIAMILGQLFGFIAWGFYVYRLYKRRQTAASAAGPGEAKSSEKSTGGSNKKISVRRKSVREKRRLDDEDEDSGDDESNSDDD